MILNQVRVDTFDGIVTNVYIICSNGEAIVIDPGGEPEKIIEMISSLKVKVKYILLTHCHADHIGAVNNVKDKFGGKVLSSRIESEEINNPVVNLGPYVGVKLTNIDVDSKLDDNDMIHVGDLEFKVIETPRSY